MRILAACSLGGAGHFNPLMAFLRAARRRGDEVVTVGPPALREMVESAGFPFRAGGEPTEEQVAAIRERLPVVPAAEASVLGNRELFGRLATTAMLAGMKDAWRDWVPDLVLRDPTEYASAVLAAQTRTPVAQVAISLAEAEAGSIAVAAPALEEHRLGLVSELLAQPYLTRFPASIDPSPFADTVRFHEPPETPVSLPDWWRGSDAPLIYMTFGTVVGHMSIAAETYRMALEAVKRANARVLLTVGRRFDASTLGPVPAHVHAAPWIDQARVVEHADLVVCHGGSGTALRRSEMHQSSPSLVNGTPVLTDAELRQLARFIAKELEALHGLQPALLTAAEVAKQYGLSRGWVYKHSRDLGGQRMGTGPKARLRFRSHEIQARLSELQASEDGMPRLRPSGTRQPVELLPIGPAGASRARAPTLRARYDRREDPSRPADRSHAPPASCCPDLRLGRSSRRGPAAGRRTRFASRHTGSAGTRPSDPPKRGGTGRTQKTSCRTS